MIITDICRFEEIEMNDYDPKKIDRNVEIVKILERYLKGIKDDCLIDNELQKAIWEMTTDINFLSWDNDTLNNLLHAREETYMFQSDKSNLPFKAGESVKVKSELINTKSTYCSLKRSDYAGKTGVVTKVGLVTCCIMFHDNMVVKFYNKHIERLEEK